MKSVKRVQRFKYDEKNELEFPKVIVKHNSKIGVKVPVFRTEGRVTLSPVFSTKEQERLFAKCAKECMSTEARLKW